MGPICLPDPAQDYDNVKALVTGWGRLKSYGILPDILQEVNVTTMTNQQCRGKKYSHSEITDYMICAGDVGRDSCQGDSGGPLSVLGQDDRYSQIGIVSWGKGCAKPGYPGVYTRLTALLPTLAIDRAQPEDGGNYVCRASNGYNEAEDRVDITVEDLQVQDSCVDNPYFANCKLIVKARYCGNKYYTKFCCRSCTLAGEAVTETKL